MGKRYEPYANALILDTRTSEKIGGTGIPHDWNISATIVATSAIPVILAGGLTPENVREAIRKVRPYGVDVHTGVKKDGVRNPERNPGFCPRSTMRVAELLERRIDPNQEWTGPHSLTFRQAEALCLLQAPSRRGLPFLRACRARTPGPGMF